MPSQCNSTIITAGNGDLIGFLGAEVTGFTIYVTLFDFSAVGSLICLYYLVKNWRNTAPHYIITAFSFILSSYNIFAFVLKSLSTQLGILLLHCPNLSSVPFEPFVFGDHDGSQNAILNIVVLPIFLWLSDAFLLYRAWIIWLDRRIYMLLPSLVFVASLISGLAWLIKTSLTYRHLIAAHDPAAVNTFDFAVFRWLPSVAFSLAMDIILTSMIAGRLIYWHIRSRKQICRSGNESGTSSKFISLTMVFIESAALSTISKILQLSVSSIVIGWNPILIPICTFASNLIILRKALGINVTQPPPTDNFTNMRFTERRRAKGSLVLDTVSCGFECHLANALGGPVLDGDILVMEEAGGNTEQQSDSV